MRKIVYIIPGYREDSDTIGYKCVMRFFKRKHVKPIMVNIHWKFRTLNDYVSEFLSFYKPITSGKIYLFGFSFGAMVALMASPFIAPDKLYLCSLSPFFKEDLSHIKKKGRKSLGKNKLRDFKKISFRTLAKQVSCTTILVAGEEESTDVLKRTAIAKREISKAKLYLARGAAHDLSQPEYLRTLDQVI
jgi:hypothetical protein